MNARQAFDWLQQEADSFMQSAHNDLGFAHAEPAFESLLFGVAAGDDPLWEEYKGNAIGDFHWSPLEAFKLAYPDSTATAAELCVFVWILPQTKATCKDNNKETFYPSERWARSRVLGEESVNAALRTLLSQCCKEKGIEAVAPMQLPMWKVVQSDRYEYASTWSERHAAHAAGLGTFGLSDGLITQKGKAIRVGSLIVRQQLPVTKRPYSHFREYCLFFINGSCKKCVQRCPAGSVTADKRYKVLCRKHVYGACSDYMREKWNLEGHACGLCQTKVPCAHKIPMAKADV